MREIFAFAESAVNFDYWKIEQILHFNDLSTEFDTSARLFRCFYTVELTFNFISTKLYIFENTSTGYIFVRPFTVSQ